MKLHPSVWEDNEPILVARGERMRVAGINGSVAWITLGCTSTVAPEDPNSTESVRAAAEQGLDQINDRYLAVMTRPKPGEVLGIHWYVLDEEGLPQRGLGLTSGLALDASSDLLTMIVNLPGRWPEVAARIEQDRAQLGLSPLSQVWS